MIMMVAIFCIRTNGVRIVSSSLGYKLHTVKVISRFLFPTANLNGDTKGTVAMAVTAKCN